MLGYKLEKIVSCNPQTFAVDMYVERARLYIRFMQPHANLWPKDSVVIANIGFERQRSGHGTALLRFLTESSDKYGYTTIGLEETHDKDCIQNFVKKYEFQPWQTSGNTDRNNRNWIVTVDALRQQLGLVH